MFFALLTISATWAADSAETAAAESDVQRPQVIVVVGAEGTPEYGRLFRIWTERWQLAAERGQTECKAIGLDDSEMLDRDLLRERLAAAATTTDRPLWLVLIGHGTFDGKTSRFNLRGPDVSSAELAEWLRRVERPLAVALCFASSGPFLSELSGENRVILSATRSGHEHNFSRFGDYLSAAVADAAGDLDKDDQTSMLEAFLLASSRLKEFYDQDARLATEHALLDDNGDKLGTPSDWFQGVRAVKTAKDGASPDGQLASQLALIPSKSELQLSPDALARRNALEAELARVREQKPMLSEDEYLAQLEKVLVALARLYEDAAAPNDANSH